jgi:predicted metal-binding membrane protein
MGEPTVTERILRRERLIVAGALVAITLLAWLYVVLGAGTGMSVRAMTTWEFPPPFRPTFDRSWTAEYALIMAAMWWAMMVAMMVPSAAPMILLYARAMRHAQKEERLASAVVPTATFASGYLLVWLAFSLAATAAQWGLEQAGLVHAMAMWSIDSTLTGAVLIAAGIYQLTPLKRTCLRQCRAPAQFLSRHWRPGSAGALRLGAVHGLNCVGCCWVLMALLFAGGIMNLVWIAGIALFILLEKVAPHGPLVGRLSGAVLLAAGLYICVAG